MSMDLKTSIEVMTDFVTTIKISAQELATSQMYTASLLKVGASRLMFASCNALNTLG